jgi:hypothetical protein
VVRDFVSDFARIAISEAGEQDFEGQSVCDLEDFDFFHCEFERTRENSFRVQAGAVRVK